MSRDCIRAEPTELSARQRRLTGVARRIAALDSWREIMHEPDLLAGTLADLPGIRKPVTNQVTTSVRRVCQAVRKDFRVDCGDRRGLGVLATGDASEREMAWARDLRGVSEGMLEFREARWSCRAVRAPVTRVFSLYVVQAGSACPRSGRQACSYSVQPGW